MPAESDLANPYRKSPAWPTMVFLGSSGKQMVDCWWCRAWRKSTFVSGGFARDVAGEKEGRFPSMLGVGTAAAAPDATRAVTNCRRSKVIRFPRETRIVVCGLCGRFLSLDSRPQKSIILLFCLGEKRLSLWLRLRK